MAGRGGDRFSPSGAQQRLGQFGRPDRFDVRPRPDTGVYPRKGRGLGVAGEAAFPDLLAQADRTSGYQAWRLGMKLAFNGLVRDARQYLPVQVMDRPAFAPQEGWRYRDALLVVFPSRGSPDGRWTVAVKPKGADISPLPLADNSQKEVVTAAEDGRTLRLLQVDVGATWGKDSLLVASSLIGELVEDTGLDPANADDENEAVILLCVGVYPEQGVMLFDGTQLWWRERLASGRRILRRRDIAANEAVPQFRSGRHLCSSTALSCNCPQSLGIEYARLRPGERLGGQGLFPTRGPEGESAMRAPHNLAEEILGMPPPPVRQDDPLEGVARRFFSLSWQRTPEVACKHCHAVRFAMGCPIEEPSDYMTLASDYWDGMKAMAGIEELQAPLSSPRFLRELRRTLLNEDAFAGLSSTMTSGCVGDVYGVTPGRLVLDPRQVNAIAISDETSSFRRFNEQLATTEPQQGESAVLGDLWLGRGTQSDSHLYELPGVVMDEPFYTNGTAATAVMP